MWTLAPEELWSLQRLLELLLNEVLPTSPWIPTITTRHHCRVVALLLEPLLSLQFFYLTVTDVPTSFWIKLSSKYRTLTFSWSVSWCPTETANCSPFEFPFVFLSWAQRCSSTYMLRLKRIHLSSCLCLDTSTWKKLFNFYVPEFIQEIKCWHCIISIHIMSVKHFPCFKHFQVTTAVFIISNGRE